MLRTLTLALSALLTLGAFATPPALYTLTPGPVAAPELPDGEGEAHALLEQAISSLDSGEPKQALMFAEDVLTTSDDPALRSNALNVQVRAFVMHSYGSPKKLKPYLKKFTRSDDELRDTLELAARVYFESGKTDASVYMWNRLIRDHKDHARIMAYQLQVLRAIDVYGDPSSSAQELNRSTQLYAHIRDNTFTGSSSASFQGVGPMLSEHLATRVDTLTGEAEATRNPLHAALAVELSDVWFEHFPGTPAPQALHRAIPRLRGLVTAAETSARLEDYAGRLAWAQCQDVPDTAACVEMWRKEFPKHPLFQPSTDSRGQTP